MKATQSGRLIELDKCQIIIPGGGTIVPRILPDISDSKSAAYSDEPIMGRSSPSKTYSHSENRVISMTLHFFAESKDQANLNLKQLRWIESAAYPRSTIGDAPFTPPPVCTIQCGKVLGNTPLCVVLKSYSLKLPTDVPWDDETYLPWKYDVDTSWDVVYRTVSLPGAEKIVQSGV